MLPLRLLLITKYQLHSHYYCCVILLLASVSPSRLQLTVTRLLLRLLLLLLLPLPRPLLLLLQLLPLVLLVGLYSSDPLCRHQKAGPAALVATPRPPRPTTQKKNRCFMRSGTMSALSLWMAPTNIVCLEPCSGHDPRHHSGQSPNSTSSRMASVLGRMDCDLLLHECFGIEARQTRPVEQTP